MKHHPSDVDSIPRWRDRPAGGTSDEDRAAALARDAAAPGVFSVELDDRQLSAIADSLKTERRARPPFWLRPALVAALLTLSMASVMGYEAGWFAPLRQRLRFRSIPPAAPESAAHAKRHAALPAPPAAPEAPPAPAEDPPAGVAAAESTPAPVAPRAPAAKRVVAPAVPEVAVADTPPPAPVVAPAQPPASEEITALEDAVGLLRGKHDALAALEALDRYIARFPKGVLAPEARVARIDALLMLDRADEALRALETLPLDAHRRSTELQLIRGELRARTDCARAEADFTAVLARVRAPALEERALYGRAACRSSSKNTVGAAADLRRYLERFSNGAHADWARRWLENSR